MPCASQAQVEPCNSCCRRSWGLRRWGTVRGWPWLLPTWRPLTSSARRRQGTAQSSAAARSLQGEGCVCTVRQQQWTWAHQQLALQASCLLVGRTSHCPSRQELLCSRTGRACTCNFESLGCNMAFSSDVPAAHLCLRITKQKATANASSHQLSTQQPCLLQQHSPSADQRHDAHPSQTAAPVPMGTRVPCLQIAPHLGPPQPPPVGAQLRHNRGRCS